MKKIQLLGLICTLAIMAACTVSDREQPTPTIPEDQEVDKNIECTKDADCAVGGCSSQVCGPAEEVNDMFTTCEYKEEYACYRLSSCKCIENTCSWEKNSQLLQCLEDAKIQSSVE